MILSKIKRVINKFSDKKFNKKIFDESRENF